MAGEGRRTHAGDGGERKGAGMDARPNAPRGAGMPPARLRAAGRAASRPPPSGDAARRRPRRARHQQGAGTAGPGGWPHRQDAGRRPCVVLHTAWPPTPNRPRQEAAARCGGGRTRREPSNIGDAARGPLCGLGRRRRDQSGTAGTRTGGGLASRREWDTMAITAAAWGSPERARVIKSCSRPR